jgi:hypothetical protein
MAFTTIDPNLRKPEITPAQEAALMRHVGYNGPLEEASVRLSPEQKTKLTIMAKAFKSMRAGKMPIKTGDTIGVAKGGYLFSPDELNDPRVKNRMKDNPEFSEFSVDQQDATANKMQQRFAQPEDRMRQQPVRGYAQGGDGFNQDADTDSEIAQQKAADDARLAAQQQPPTPPVAPAPVQPRPPETGGVYEPAPKINEPQATLPGGLMQPLAPNMYNNALPLPPSKRPANVPDWMVANPNFNPMGRYATVMRTYTNPVTGETYDGTGAGQYMVDPKIGKDATTYDVTTNQVPRKAIDPRALERQRQPIQKNPNLLEGYYDSPEFQKTRNFGGAATADMGGVNPYTGSIGGSSSIAGMNVRAYEDYLNRTGNTSYLRGGADYVEPESITKYNQDQAEGRRGFEAQRPQVDGTLGTPIDRPLSPDLQKRVDSGDMIDGRTLTPAELAQVEVQPIMMRGGMGTFYRMKLNGKSIILTTEQKRPLIDDRNARYKEFADSQGLLQSAPIAPNGDITMATPQYQAQAGQTADPAATPEVPLTPVQQLAADQATTMANVYGDPSKVITPGNVVSTPSGPDTTIAAGTGEVSSTDPSVAIPGATGVATTTAPAVEGPKGVMSTSNVAPSVAAAASTMTSATGTVGADSQVTAATDETSAVSTLKAEQGTATLMTNPVQRKIEAGELVTGVADATTAAAFTEQVQAATALPSVKATVQGQLATLMDDFADGKSPVWAAGAMRAANAAMAARGLGASSMAGQAIIQATMEAALPIAQADAQVTAQFEAQNLSNRQQRAMLAAEQRANFMGMEFTQEFQARVQNSARIGDIANMNFTAEQQIALENSKIANTMNLANLSNSQAVVMAEAAALSNLEMSNLNNRQQAAVQNAQNFMQMDMQNLGNAQQTTMFKQQQIMQSLFTDQAAANVTSQINAASENQTQQFFASLVSQAQQFNATQTNAMSQFDAGQVNTIKRFNKEIENQRDQFNATNRLVIAQANTKWRQNIATIDTAAQNEANMQYAKSINDLTSTAIDQLWQRERDLMGFAFKASESASDRALKVALQELDSAAKESLQDDIGKGAFLGTILDGVVGSIFGT